MRMKNEEVIGKGKFELNIKLQLNNNLYNFITFQ